MKAIAALLLLSVLGFATADFADLTGKIKSLNATDGEKIRDLTVIKIPDQDPRIVVLKGVALDFINRKRFDIDAVVFALNTLGRTTIQFGYFHAARDANGGNSVNPVSDFDASAFGFVLRFIDVFEFVDQNGIPGFQFGQDNITGSYNLSHPALSWKLSSQDVSQTGTDGKTFTVRIFTAETSDKVFALRFVCAGRALNVDGHEIRPDQCKFDLRIRWFNNSLHVPAAWTTGPSAFPTAQVGIVGAYGAAGGSFKRRVNADINNSTEINFDFGKFKALFKWVTEASCTIGGVVVKKAVRDFDVDIGGVPVEIDVASTFVGGWVKKIIIHSFDGERPSEIVLDPEFGPQIDYALVDSGFGIQIAPSFVQALMMIFALLFVFKH